MVIPKGVSILSPEQRLESLSIADSEKYVKKRKAASKRAARKRPDTPS
jgi:hypothetical protein